MSYRLLSKKVKPYKNIINAVMAVNKWNTEISVEDDSWQSICWSPELGLFCAVASAGSWEGEEHTFH